MNAFDGNPFTTERLAVLLPANHHLDSRRASEIGALKEGALVDRGFVVDNVLHNTAEGDIHFSLHVPVSHDGTRPFALYVHCPGWEGLWFQGVGAHLVEDFVFVANDYVSISCGTVSTGLRRAVHNLAECSSVDFVILYDLSRINQSC